MAKIIANQQTWIGFAANVANIAAPNVTTEIATAINLTPLAISVTASTQGNTVPVPTLDSLFEGSVAGVAQGTFSGDFYLDDGTQGTIGNLAWTTLPRGAKGYFIVSRFGGTGANLSPAHNQNCEVWPVYITARAASALTSNQAQTFTITAAIPAPPNESAVAN